MPFVLAAAFPALAAASQRSVLPAGSDMEITLTLMGRATAHYREVRRAVEDMARSGLGEDGSYFLFDLAEVTLIDEPEGKSTGVPLGEVVSARVGELNGLRSIGLRSITPLRIELKTQGGAKRLQERPTLEMIATEIAWRFRLLAEVHGQPVGDMKSAAKALVSAMNTTDEAWRWDDNTKHNSARHGDRLTFGGAMGEVRIEGDTLGLLLPLLAAGEILHVGKVTSSGLGRYELVRPASPGTGGRFTESCEITEPESGRDVRVIESVRAYETTTLYEERLLPTGVVTDGNRRWSFFSRLAGYMLTDRMVKDGLIDLPTQGTINRAISDFDLLESMAGQNEVVIVAEATAGERAAVTHGADSSFTM